MLDEASRSGESERASEPATSPSVAVEPHPCVLLATTGTDYPAEADELSTELVGRLKTELVVFHVARGSGPDDFVRAVVERATELAAVLVILPAREQHGHRVLSLARALKRPVLVTRLRLGSGAVLAATDLDHPEFPVVHQAAELGRLLRTRVVTVHNVPRAADHAHPMQALLQATQTFRVGSAVLTRHDDHAEAILNEARARAAATIVLGCRVDGAALRRGCVTSDVLHLARESVFLVPIFSEPEAAVLGEGQAGEAAAVA